MKIAKQNKRSALLALEDGRVFYGDAIGAVDSIDYSCGELVFNTSSTGYQEIITDPSYCQQIIMFTTPHIGNVGVNDDDVESNSENKIWSNGIVIKSLAKQASNWRSENDLNTYLERNNLIGIANVDTRELTRHLRTYGAKKCCISILHDNLDNKQDLEQEAISLAKNSRALGGLDLAKEVTTAKQYQWTKSSYKLNTPNEQWQEKEKEGENRAGNSTNKQQEFHIVVYDFGVKQQILKLLRDRSCRVTVVPAQTDYQQVLALNPDGVLLSNGPGDPQACSYAIENTKSLIKSGIPLFGICLGFQIMALALGAKTTKMKFGHHGGNHPVQDLISGKVLITSQNHGFMVESNSLNGELIISHRSLFDKTVQGIMHKKLPVFGFQGHPEASPGPNDIEYLFDKFINDINDYKVMCHFNQEQANSA